jgi:tetratricopeptide (TPR) repeat protein
VLSVLRKQSGGLLLAGVVAVGGAAAVGLVSYRRASAELAQAHEVARKNARAVLETAQAAQSQGRFHDAREGYLRALALDPNLADARYGLAILTHAAGANDEASHDLAELEKIAPGDPRIAQLKELLKTP